MRRWALIAATPVLSVFLGATAIAIIAALTANPCLTPTGGTGDRPSASAIGQIPAQLLAIYEQVGARYDLPGRSSPASRPRNATKADSTIPPAPSNPAPPAPASPTPPARPA
jgi:hypothetical protein